MGKFAKEGGKSQHTPGAPFPPPHCPLSFPPRKALPISPLPLLASLPPLPTSSLLPPGAHRLPGKQGNVCLRLSPAQTIQLDPDTLASGKCVPLAGGK